MAGLEGDRGKTWVCGWHAAALPLPANYSCLLPPCLSPSRLSPLSRGRQATNRHGGRLEGQTCRASLPPSSPALTLLLSLSSLNKLYTPKEHCLKSHEINEGALCGGRRTGGGGTSPTTSPPFPTISSLQHIFLFKRQLWHFCGMQQAACMPSSPMLSL